MSRADELSGAAGTGPEADQNSAVKSSADENSAVKGSAVENSAVKGSAVENSAGKSSAEDVPGGTSEPVVAVGRRRLTIASVLLLLFAVGSAAVGQVLLKHGMEGARHKAEHGGSLAISAATSPWVILGLVVFGVSALAWLTTLSKLPLSIAYPFNALGYLGILTASVLILHERANVWTWFGTAFVVAGLIIVVATKPS